MSGRRRMAPTARARRPAVLARPVRRTCTASPSRPNRHLCQRYGEHSWREGASVPEYEWRTQLSPRPASVPAARRAVGVTLEAWGRPDLKDLTMLVVSELLTNAIAHGRGDPGLRVQLTDDCVRLE